ncbi:hypothetical protein B0H17DRAFT_1220210 [Mycena rosella]|uniref:Uncharacterized protein n=1 Tax=Mycena rosella TaxID=1033263 RepID=A0AAD7BCL2_MYCRO|nr:hypothetical protein B0H17DRAFT_1220210 [Mycena rosella]
MDWHQQYTNRFSRLSFPGVRRVIRRQQELAVNPTVVHTFKAKSTYCLQTDQWAQRVEKRVDSKDLGLSEAFWTEATVN